VNWLTPVEFSFYLVETFALPFAILVFVIERRKERAAEAEELYQRLSDEYTSFLKLVLDNADLQLLRKHAFLALLCSFLVFGHFHLYLISGCDPHTNFLTPSQSLAARKHPVPLD
jgi:hypothetical protein